MSTVGEDLSGGAPQKQHNMQSVIRERQNWYIHLCFTRKDYQECMTAIEEQLRASKGQSEYALYVKALVMRHQGRIEESLTTFQAALCLNPTSINNLKQVGRSLFLLGKHKNALDVFSEAEKLSPEDREVFHSQGMCFLYLKQYDNAVEAFETANSIQRYEATFIQLARVYRLLGKEEEALRCYMDALEGSPENAEILTAIGLLFLRLGNNTKAFEHLGNSLTYDPKNPKTILAAGSIIQDNQDMDVALIKYRVAACQTPNSPQLWNNIGMCFFGKGKYVAAVACLKRALYFSPFEWIISYNLGIVHLTTGQYASSFHFFSTAINLQPSLARAYMYLAVTLSK
jgi:Bardet-Biedl syndrome 4 protein